MRRRTSLVTAAALAASLTASTSHAIVQPVDLQTGLELATGQHVRQMREVRWRSTAPPLRSTSWRRLVQRIAATGGATPSTDRLAVASWDADTGVPHQIVLRGVAAPGSTHSPAVAAAFAHRVLEEHLDLLAPGARPDDFVLTVNDESRGLRTVAFEQHHRGMPVIGGYVSFRFKADRLLVIASAALPQVEAAVAGATLSFGEAREAARSWLGRESLRGLTTGRVDGPQVLPIVHAPGSWSYRTVLRVDVQSTSPRAHFAVYVDAATGTPVARRQLLQFAEGTILYHVPERYPDAGHADFPAALAHLSVDGSPSTTDEAGMLTFADGGPVTVDLTATGPLAEVVDAAGSPAARSDALAPDGTITWNASDDELLDAQLSAFIHVGLAKDYAKQLAPDLGWLDDPMTVNVNIDDRCNAFYSGADGSLNFFRAGGPCENLARVTDVIYHEFGHAFHHHSMLVGSSFGDDWSALSEGLSDYYAATLSEDPGMGRGFFKSDQPLRHIDPVEGEKVWPFDVGSDPHYTGLIIGGALWDLRKALIAKLGAAEGRSTADTLFYAGMRNAADIPAMYVELLTADDDDGDLHNGTPNGCEINQAFGAHGLRAMVIESTPPSLVPAGDEGTAIQVDVQGLIGSCKGQGVQALDLSWRLRDEPRKVYQIEMAGGPEQWEATIPEQPAGTVVQYAVTIRMAEGTVVTIPQNRAAPMLEFYVGEVVPLYCTDFERDPELDGWTHGLTQGEDQEGADDWQWDRPEGASGSGDPAEAFSGTHVFGNDLGHGNYDGSYQPDKVNYASSPVVDASGFDQVRLQYRRWLNVEDGYYDQATIYANDEVVWSNFNSLAGEDSNTHHRDRQWRFHDVDLTDAVNDGSVQVRFEIATDGGLQLGGWTLDDLCIVGYQAPPQPICGDGNVDPGEQCDDGNVDSGDGCSSRCLVESAPEPAADDRAILTPQGGCVCTVGRRGSSHAPAAGLGLLALVAIAGARRRRRST
jgi:MYXO-CTERM domain-containing protein